MLKNLAPLLAEERLLMAEEKWIVEALQQIKKQRNCLQIEKLHLQSTKAALKTSKSVDMKIERKTAEGTPIQKTTTLNVSHEVEIHTRNLEEHDDATACNQREMDLSITNHLTDILGDTFQEEYEDDDECNEDNSFFVLGEDQLSFDVK